MCEDREKRRLVGRKHYFLWRFVSITIHVIYIFIHMGGLALGISTGYNSFYSKLFHLQCEIAKIKTRQAYRGRDRVFKNCVRDAIF